MGLNNLYLSFFNSNIEKCNLVGSKMLELGDQIGNIPGSTGKRYFSSLGFDHTSVDLTGDYGSIVKDLRHPGEFLEWHNNFDIITNAGTTEHVEPAEYQYNCFSILHDCLKTGGIQLHIVPSVEGFASWPIHCTVYYSMDFFTMLAKENSYDIIEMKMSSNNLLLACIKKTRDIPFMKNKDLFLNKLHLVPENIHTDIHPSSKMKK